MDVTVTTALTTIPNRTPVYSNANSNSKSSDTNLNTEEIQQIQRLKARDREVRAHEAAHIAAGAGLIRGGASFSYQRGPDGIQYATGGEVSIDTSKVANNPEATIQKAAQIRSAALAPAQPSAQDRNVAAKAAQLAIEARAELNQQRNNSDDNHNSFLVQPSNTESSSGNLFDSIT